MNVSFNTKLNNLLTQEKMSIRKLHQLTGFSRSTIARWKHGISTPTNESKQLLSEIFKIPLSYFDEQESTFYEQQINNLQKQINTLSQRVSKIEETTGVS
jgi:Helix-turn-helix.